MTETSSSRSKRSGTATAEKPALQTGKMAIFFDPDIKTHLADAPPPGYEMVRPWNFAYQDEQDLEAARKVAVSTYIAVNGKEPENPDLIPVVPVLKAFKLHPGMNWEGTAVSIAQWRQIKAISAERAKNGDPNGDEVARLIRKRAIIEFWPKEDRLHCDGSFDDYDADTLRDMMDSIEDLEWLNLAMTKVSKNEHQALIKQRIQELS